MIKKGSIIPNKANPICFENSFFSILFFKSRRTKAIAINTPIQEKEVINIPKYGIIKEFPLWMKL
jgi:hypothetical protein